VQSRFNRQIFPTLNMYLLTWINPEAMLAPFVFLMHKGENHDTSKKATFAVTSCSIFIY